ncbi:uracil-DNA glycosylase family protein [Thermospira aquatica]|uniref:Uracil-DNA glycosylase-like domain-containing protein n=1 Tax=Thermospira aquatica TaxID=2828656 RepID=A0AAX3BFY9_9SPIR|nr:hypothetical protein [Thermospira aquatica]URA11144.1 hypothetical protein KDW03_04940 [Thermospira aquatica]
MAIIVHRYLEEAWKEGKERLFWIVGSFPSVLVKEKFERLNREKDVNYFYGGGGNRFWPTLASLAWKKGLLSTPTLPEGWDNPQAVSARKDLLRLLGLGITDLYLEVETEGKASDTAIHPLRENPHLSSLLTREGCVLFATSERVLRELSRLLKKHGRPSAVELVLLPSPSPLSRRAGYNDEKLLAIYEKILTTFLTSLQA